MDEGGGNEARGRGLPRPRCVWLRLFRVWKTEGLFLP
jgi:hypothetical protein